MKTPGCIGVDLDGTLAFDYEGEFCPDKIGDPVPEMEQKVKEWISNNIRVIIFTARAHDPENIPPIKKWLKRNGFGDLKVTNVKTPDIKLIYDDKAYRVIKDTGRTDNEIPDDVKTADGYATFSLLKKLSSES